MAFLRIVRQGQPVDPELFVDLGPGVGRTVHTRGAIVGGALVVAESTRTRDLRLQRAWKAASQVPCDESTCGRFAGHMGRHVSHARVAEFSAKRAV